MEYFNIEHSYWGGINKAHLRCLQGAKNWTYLKLYLPENLKNIESLDSKESFDFVVEVVQNIIKEFQMDVEFKYSFEDRYFEFTQPKINIELYICLVFSRFLYSEEICYEKVIERMYKLKDKYSTFETFMIASSDNHYGYYSIHDKNILSIEKYRKIENKKGMFEQQVNFSICKKLSAFTYSDKDYSFLNNNEDIEKYYFSKLEELKNNTLILYKIGDYKINENLYPVNYYNCLRYKDERSSFLYYQTSGKSVYKSNPTFIEKEELIKLIPLTKKGKLKKGNKEYKILKAHEQFTN